MSRCVAYPGRSIKKIVHSWGVWQDQDYFVSRGEA